MKMSTEILAPMPGTIFQVQVSAGDDVVEGQELLVLEAMKMENPIVSTAAGKVKEVLVNVDDKVATKQLLLVIE
jgi:methylmalonyl-CoA carboxyltransferase small subunit